MPNAHAHALPDTDAEASVLKEPLPILSPLPASQAGETNSESDTTDYMDTEFPDRKNYAYVDNNNISIAKELVTATGSNSAVGGDTWIGSTTPTMESAIKSPSLIDLDTPEPVAALDDTPEPAASLEGEQPAADDDGTGAGHSTPTTRPIKNHLRLTDATSISFTPSPVAPPRSIKLKGNRFGASPASSKPEQTKKGTPHQVTMKSFITQSK